MRYADNSAQLRNGFPGVVCSLYLVFEHLDLDLKRYMDENKDTFNRNHRLIKVRHTMSCIT